MVEAADALRTPCRGRASDPHVARRRLGLLRSHCCRITAAAAPSAEATVATPSASAWRAYRDEGVRRANALGNRGTIRFGSDGRLAADIVESYREHGFYVFKQLVSHSETDAVLHEFDEVLLKNAPTSSDSDTDRLGRPSAWAGYYSMRDPSDHTVRTGPNATALFQINHPFMFCKAALPLYGHRNVLSVAAGINGDDFIPMNEVFFYKAAQDAAITPYHQDGGTHWGEGGESLADSDPR